MKKEIRLIDEQRGIIQITTSDSRWYSKQVTDEKTGLPKTEFVPSITWICDHYPKSTAFYKWLADKGWDEAQALKTAAGDKGSKVHLAIAMLLEGCEITPGTFIKNSEIYDPEPISTEEYQAVLSFAAWYEEVKPKVLGHEFVVWGDGYAGTIDLHCEINGKPYIVDFKTGQNIWPSYELQLSAYKNAETRLSNCSLAILQVGYRLNKKKYKFTDIEDQYTEFLATKVIWAREQKNIHPRTIELPLSIKLKSNAVNQESEHATTTPKQ